MAKWKERMAQVTPEQRAAAMKVTADVGKATEEAKVAEQRVQTQQQRVQTQQERVHEWSQREAQAQKNLELTANRMQQLHTRVDNDFRQRLAQNTTPVTAGGTRGY